MNSGSITGLLVPLGTLAFTLLGVLGIDATLGPLGFLMTRLGHKLEFRLAWSVPPHDGHFLPLEVDEDGHTNFGFGAFSFRLGRTLLFTFSLDCLVGFFEDRSDLFFWLELGRFQKMEFLHYTFYTQSHRCQQLSLHITCEQFFCISDIHVLYRVACLESYNALQRSTGLFSSWP